MEQITVIHIVKPFYRLPFGFWKEADCKAASKGLGEFGSDGNYDTLRIYKDFEAFKNVKEEEDKKAALAKLTPYERHLLGIK